MILLLTIALAGNVSGATNATIYEVSPRMAVLSERKGQLVSADYIAGELIVAYIPEEIFSNGFDHE